MRLSENGFPDEGYAKDIAVMSGVRPCGRSTDHRGGRAAHGLLYLFEGEACFTRGRNELILHAGELLYLPEGEKYTMVYTAERSVFVLINFHLFLHGKGPFALAPCMTVMAREKDKDGRILPIMAAAELCSAPKNAFASLRKKELLYRLLGLIYRGPTELPERREGSPIAAGVRLLQGTYLENLPISRFAEESHMSISSFRAHFRAEYGTSPVGYRNSLRIERARELLASGDYTVAEAAYACGFENVGYFCRIFRRETGSTPGGAKKQEI